MTAWEKEVEEKLVEAGNQLLSPPSSDDELLSLLDYVENCLTKVEQSPSESMQEALSASKRALVADNLLRHPNIDVKVAVAASISEITRITAPDAPYDDDQMKEVFRLIVSSFEGLHDESSRSYSKRALILETVAKVRSCVVMLDLECDALIIEMFQHFLKSIRDYHSENIFASMETIMTLVLEESEDVPFEFILPILECLKKDNKDVSPIAKNLAQRVLDSCAAKLKPCLEQTVKTMGISLHDYSEVVARICQVMPAAEHEDGNTVSDNLAGVPDMPKTSSECVAEVVKETPAEIALSEEAPPSIGGSPKSIGGSPKSATSNGTVLKGADDDSVGQDPVKELDIEHHADSEAAAKLCKAESVDDEKAAPVVKPQSRSVKASKRKRRKSLSVRSPSGLPESPADAVGEKVQDHREIRSKDVGTSVCEDSAADAAATSGKEKEASVPDPSPKASENDAIDIVSPSPSGVVPDENRSRKGGQGKGKHSSVDEVILPARIKSKKVLEGFTSYDVKTHKRIGRKSRAENNETNPDDASKKEGESRSLLDVNSKSSNKVEPDGNQQEDMKKRAKGKSVPGKDKTPSKDDEKKSVSLPKPEKDKTPSKDDERTSQKPNSLSKTGVKRNKNGSQLGKTPKGSSKKKRTSVVDQVSEAKDYGEELVGSCIKVWWPDDNEYYEGKIESFNPEEKKHTVLYTDGDVEILHLKDEVWEFIDESLVVPHKEEARDIESPNESLEMNKKKKAKTKSGSSSKQGNRSKKGSLSKGKDTPSKPGRKLKIDAKADTKSKDDIHSGAETEDDKGDKSDSKDGSSRSVDVTPRISGKSKDKDDETDAPPKSSTKSKSEMPKKSTKPKSKSAKSGSKSDANGDGKGKASSSKVKEAKEMETDDDDVDKTPESTKLPEKTKSVSFKMGKKRPRGD